VGDTVVVAARRRSHPAIECACLDAGTKGANLQGAEISVQLRQATQTRAITPKNGVLNRAALRQYTSHAAQVVEGLYHVRLGTTRH